MMLYHVTSIVVYDWMIHTVILLVEYCNNVDWLELVRISRMFQALIVEYIRSLSAYIGRFFLIEILIADTSEILIADTS